MTTKTLPFTCRRLIYEEILHNTISRAKLHGQPPSAVQQTAVSTWTDKACEVWKKQGLLLSEKQYHDLQSGLKFEAGLRCRFVGESRNEKLEGHTYRRESGQLGTVFSVEKSPSGDFIVFRPDEEGAPDLIIKENTPSYGLLEII